MAEIEIGQETEAQGCWSYEVFVYDHGKRYRYEARLGWSDYDHWSGGGAAPAAVMRAVFEFLLARNSPSAINREFDCSTVRRRFPDMDDELPKMV